LTAGALRMVEQPDAGSSPEAVERLFEMSCELLGTASLDGYLTRLNPAWERTLGWTREQLMREPFTSFVHPEDVEATMQAAASLAQPGRQEVVAFVNRYRTATGEYRWLEWSSIADGATIYFVAKDVTVVKALEAERSEDLTRMRRSEALHRTLSSNLPDATVFLLDPDLRILLATGEAVRRLPWFREDLFIGSRVSELYSTVPGHVLDRAIENYLAVLRGERRRFEFSSEGSTFAVHAVPVYSETGAVEAALVVACDVTEQHQLTDDLRRSEERLRKAEELVGGGSWEVSLDDETLTWSDGLCRIHGASPAGHREPLSAYVERINPAQRAVFREEISRCVRSGRAAFEYRITRQDGAVRTLTVEAELVDGEPGQACLVRGAVLDVTDERAGFDASPLGMMVAEPEQLRLIRVNQTLCSILGRPREELLGQTIRDLTHPDERAGVTEQQQVLIGGAAGTYETEKRFLRADGSAVWVAVYVTALHHSGGSVRAFLIQVVDITERRNRAAEVETARLESLRRLAIASEYRDNETHEHTERVGLTSMRIGRALGMSEAQLDLLRQAAPLHDIGKVGISDLILLKPGRLTDQERTTMERHTLIGADIVSGSESPVLQMAEKIALTHHERWDGAGYPHQLAGETIPLVGRIVAVADVFDALTHERPYKEAWPIDRAVAHVCAESGSHFDPAVVSAFRTLDPAAVSAPELTGHEVATPQRALAERAATAGSLTGSDRDLPHPQSNTGAQGEQRQAQIDPLTGALGLGLGTVALGREIERARHGNGRLVLALVHVDGLTQANERTGRAAGDLLLRAVVDAIQMHLRSHDPIVRVGDDEFACALVDATSQDVRDRFEQIQATLQDAHPGALISVGLAELRHGDSLEVLTARANEALHVPPQGPQAPNGRLASRHQAPGRARGGEPRRAADRREPEWRRAFGDALRAGDPGRAHQAVAQALADGLSVAAVQDRVIAPAMRWIGDLWQRGALTVADEHLATAITQDVLGRLFPRTLRTPSGSRERIVLAAAQGEHHILGLRMAADALEGAGFEVLYLGPDVPLSGLLNTCRTHTPAAVGLTVSMAVNVPTLIGEIEALCRLDRPPAIFAAGRAIGPAIAQGLDVPGIDGIEQLLPAVETLLAGAVKRRVVPAGLSARVPPAPGSGELDSGTSGGHDEAFSRAALSAADAARDAARHAFAMEQLAFRDVVTGLGNRRAYDDRYAEVSDPSGPGGSVLMVDVDRFKRINDTHGHEAGDAALIRLGQVMLRSVGPDDFVARHGGDEFAILLPGADVDAAIAVAQRIRDAAQRDLTEPALTVSIGVSSIKPTQLQTFLAVDRALYEAKEQGRNSVAAAPE
jgi:diguanylate cyclase (GGDEF)-like protein/PAS domain S-box-containing protein